MASLKREPLARFIGEQTALFKGFFREVRRAPGYVRVHELRLATRRLRAALWLLPPHYPHRHRLRRSLKNLDQRLGGLRELDVALRDSREKKLPTHEIEKQRNEQRVRLRRYLGGPHGEELMACLKKSQSDLNQIKTGPDAHRLQSLQRRVSACSRMPLKKTANIHRLRIQLKRVRYALEALGRPTAPLAALQDTLGKFHDLEVLSSFHGNTSVTLVANGSQLSKLDRARKNAVVFSRRQLARLERAQ